MPYLTLKVGTLSGRGNRQGTERRLVVSGQAGAPSD